MLQVAPACKSGPNIGWVPGPLALSRADPRRVGDRGYAAAAPGHPAEGRRGVTLPVETVVGEVPLVDDRQHGHGQNDRQATKDNGRQPQAALRALYRYMLPADEPKHNSRGAKQHCLKSQERRQAKSAAREAADEPA